MTAQTASILLGQHQIRSPFKGLASFEEGDAPLFFGRQTERRLCLANFKANRLTVLYAPSGVGKTSLLAAGVVPDIRKNARRADENSPPSQAVLLMNTWTDNPLGRLEGMIDAAMQDGSLPIEKLEPGLESRVAAWSKWMRGPVLLILDQFERLYTGRLDPKIIDGFIEELAGLVDCSDFRVNLLLSVREDSLSVLDHLGDYVPAAKRNWLSLGELTHEGAREAITGPIRWWNESYSDDRVEIDEASREAFTEHVLAACRSPRKGLYRASDEARHDAPLLQMMMERLWGDAHRQKTKLGPVSLSGGTSREAILEEYVQKRLDKLPEHLQETAVIVFSDLISPAARSLPQSHSELVHRNRPGRKPLDSETVQDLLALLSGGERGGRILQEIPGDPEPLYTILQDFLVKPIHAWVAKWVQENEAYLRDRMWPKVKKWLPTVCLALLGVGVLALAWMWGDSYFHEKAVRSLAVEQRVDGQNLERNVNKWLSKAGASDRDDNTRLLAMPDGALFWSAWRAIASFEASVPRAAIKVNATEEDGRTISPPIPGRTEPTQVNIKKAWSLPPVPLRDLFVGQNADHLWMVCAVKPARGVDGAEVTETLLVSSEECRSVPNSSESSDIGFFAGKSRVAEPATESRSSGSGAIFLYNNRGRFTFWSYEVDNYGTLSIKEAHKPADMPNWKEKETIISASAAGDLSDLSIGHSLAIALLSGPDLGRPSVTIFWVNENKTAPINIEGEKIAILPGRPRHLAERIGGSDNFTIAVSQKRQKNKIRTYSIDGHLRGRYPDEDEYFIQKLWPASRR
jgi:hypothetical protein